MPDYFYVFTESFIKIFSHILRVKILMKVLLAQLLLKIFDLKTIRPRHFDTLHI